MTTASDTDGPAGDTKSAPGTNVAAAIVSQIEGASKPRVRRLADIMDDGVALIGIPFDA